MKPARDKDRKFPRVVPVILQKMNDAKTMEEKIKMIREANPLLRVFG